MPDKSLEEIIQEEAFADLLQAQAGSFFRLGNTLLGRAEWKKHFYQLHTESDELESFLDDYGAGFNRTFALIRELVASVRWFGLAGFSCSHLKGRFETYGVVEALSDSEVNEAQASLQHARAFVRGAIGRVLEEVRETGLPDRLVARADPV